MKCLSTRLEKPVRSLGSRKVSSENGVIAERLEPLKHPVGCGCSISQVSIHPLIEKPKKKTTCSRSFTPESLLLNKKTILKDRKNISETIYLTNVPEPNLTTYQTLDQVSTLKDPDCYRFWDLSKKEKYQQLSWLQEIDWPGLDLNSLNGSVKSLEPSYWFSTLKIQPLKQNLEKTSCPSFRFIAVDGTGGEDIPKKKIKALKLKIKPTLEQKRKLNQWAGCVRFLYNKSIALLTNKKNKTLRSVFKLRDRLVTVKGNEYWNQKNQNNFYNNKEWLKECPKSIKQEAIKEAKANLQACYTNRKRGNIENFDKPFKTKKHEMLKGWSLGLEKANISKQGNQLFIFKTLLGEMKYFKTKQLHKIIPDGKPSQDCRIQKNEFGEYFLIVPYVCTPKKPMPKEIKNPASGDPGGRKFLTTYSPMEKESYIFGNRASSVIMEELLALDKMYSELSKECDVKKRKMLKRIIKMKRKRVFYLKAELKYQVANFISKRYDLFMMPKLEVGKLTEKAGRKLKTKAVRQLLNLGHSKFFETLKDKCWENGCQFLLVREEYTSQTCPCCGKLNKCNELYKCIECGFQSDRDIVGALNIFLKAIRLTYPRVFS